MPRLVDLRQNRPSIEQMYTRGLEIAREEHEQKFVGDMRLIQMRSLLEDSLRKRKRYSPEVAQALSRVTNITDEDLRPEDLALLIGADLDKEALDLRSTLFKMQTTLANADRDAARDQAMLELDLARREGAQRIAEIREEGALARIEASQALAEIKAANLKTQGDMNTELGNIRKELLEMRLGNSAETKMLDAERMRKMNARQLTGLIDLRDDKGKVEEWVDDMPSFEKDDTHRAFGAALAAIEDASMRDPATGAATESRRLLQPHEIRAIAQQSGLPLNPGIFPPQSKEEKKKSKGPERVTIGQKPAQPSEVAGFDFTGAVDEALATGLAGTELEEAVIRAARKAKGSPLTRADLDSLKRLTAGE